MNRPANPPRSPASPPADLRATSLHDEIASQAHILWEHYGHPSGRDESIWLEAERQVLGADRKVSRPPGAGSLATAGLAESLNANVAPPEGAADLRRHAR